MKRRAGRRWWRRLLILAAVAAVGRLCLAMALPWLVDLAAGSAGLSATCRSSSLSLLGLSLHLQDLVLQDSRGGARLASAQEVRVDLSTWQLLHGEFVVVEAILAGCRVELVRAADGTFVLPPELLRSEAPGPDPAPTPVLAPAPDQPDFALPFCILAARVHDLRLHIRDEDANARQTDLVLDLDLADLGHRERPCQLDVRAHSPGLCDQLHVVATAPPAAQRLAVAWQVTVSGLALAPLPLPAEVRSVLGEAAIVGLDLGGNLALERDTARTGDLLVATDLQATVALDGHERLTMRAKFGPTESAENGLRAPFACEVRSAGLVDVLELVAGQLDLATDRLEVGARLACRGLTPRALAPWLAPHGISVDEPGLDVAARLHAELPRQTGGAFSARLDELTVGSGAPQLALASLAIDDVRTAAQHIEIGSITADGPRLAVQHDIDGGWSVAGLHFRATNLPAPTIAAPVPASLSPPPAVLLRKLDWHGVNIVFADLTLPAPATLSVQGLAVTGDNLEVVGDQLKCHLTATLRAADAIQSFHAEVHVVPGHGGTAADLQCDVRGIAGSAMTPWLAAQGITVDLQDGTLSLAASAVIGREEAATTIDARLADVRLVDRGEVLLSLRNAEVSGMRVGPAALDLGTVRIDEPFLLVHTAADATRTIGGLRVQATTQGTEPRKPAGAAADGPALTLAGATLQGAKVLWRDLRHDRTPPIGLDATIGAIGGAVATTSFTATLRLEQAIEALELRGQFVDRSGEVSVAAEVVGRGIHGAALVPLLPDHLSSPLVDGSLRARLKARTRALASGRSLDVSLTDVVLADRAEELLAIDALEVRVPELGEHRIHVASAQLRGVRAVAAATDQGLLVPGLLLRAAAPTSGNGNEPTPAMKALATPPWPALQIDELDLLCDRFVFRDHRGPEVEPLVASLRVLLEQPWATAEELTETLPLRFSVQASALPLCRQFTATGSLQPFLLAPAIDLEVRVVGLDPTALARLAPPAGPPIDGAVTDAVLTAKVHAELDLHRRDPRRFDFTQPFGGLLVVEQLALRSTADGASLLAIDSLEVAARAIDPPTGDVLLRSVDLDAPVLAARQTAQGLVVAGFVLRPAVDAPAAATAPTSAGPSPEFAIDRLRVQGMAFDYRDDTTSPATHLPVQELDLEVQRFSTRARTEPRPFAFDLRLQGGDIQLDRRIERSSMVARLVGSAAAMLSGSTVREHEARPLVDELAVAGQWQFFPHPKGTVRASIHGFEVAALRGLARAGGVQIGDGLLDASLEVLRHSSGATDVRGVSTFTGLSMSEPAGGPISTWLRLPAPLDSVLFLLRNDADQQRLPMQMHFPATGSSTATVAEAAIEALALAIGDAVARSPLRVFDAVKGQFGLGTSTEPGPTAACTFPPGETQLDPAELSSLLATTGNDPNWNFVLVHELGAADLEPAARRANPSAAIVQAAVARLQGQQGELGLARTTLAVDTAAAYAAGQVQTALAHHAALRVLDTRLGELETTLDAALGMLVEAGPRQADRATREAAVAIGQARIEAVRAALVDRLGPAAAGRIEVRRPRGLPVTGIDGGGRVVLTARRRI